MKKAHFPQIAILLAVIFTFATLASAANCRVTKTADTNDGACTAGDCSLREAVAEPSCTLIDFSLGLVEQPVTVTLGDIVIDRPLTIRGYGADAITIAGNNVFRIFYIAAGGNATIANVKLTGGGGNGTGVGGGGAIRNNGGTLNLDGVYLTGNSSQGGAALAGNAIIRNSTIAGNISGAGYYDAAVAAGMTLRLYNSTVSDNTGPGIFTQGFPDVVNSTIGGNSGPGVMMDFAAIFETSNSIVLGVFQYDQWSGVFSFGNNIFSNAPGTVRPIPAGGSDLIDVDPMLAPLGYYGGRVPTRPLLAASPGIDRGNNQRAIDAGLTTDQRGHQRFFDGDGNGSAIVDTGAVEFGAPVASAVTVSGRLLTASGNPLRSVSVIISDLQGNSWPVLTSSLGWFVFEGLPADRVYKISLSSKRYSMTPAEKVIFADQNLSDVDITVDAEAGRMAGK